MRSVRANVNDRQRLAVTFTNCARPCAQADPLQGIKRNVAEMALLDPHRHGGAAIAMGRRTVELAWAAPRAVAGCDLWSTNTPIDVCHGRFPTERAIGTTILELCQVTPGRSGTSKAEQLY